MSLYWVWPVLLLVGYTAGTAMSRRLSEARCVFPVVGKPFAFAPRFISNLAFAFNATNLIQQGYAKVVFLWLGGKDVGRLTLVFSPSSNTRPFS